MSTYNIYGLGAALVDTEISLGDEDLHHYGIDKGVMTLVDEQRQHQLLGLLQHHLVESVRASGGSAANSIIAAQYFGASTFFSCKVADDDNGRFYLADMARAGVTCASKAAQSPGITGKCLVMITPDAERTMNTFLGISETLSVSEIDEDALKASQTVYIEGYLVTSASGHPAAIKLRQLAEQYGVKTAMSLSDPGIVEYFDKGLREIIGGGVDLLFCNRAEAQTFTRTETLEQAAAALREYARTYVITLGAEGALLFDGAQQLRIAAPKVRALDSNGAGDMFAGAFLYGLSQNWSFQRAGELAVRAAAQVVAQYGPRLQPEQHQQLLAEFCG